MVKKIGPFEIDDKLMMKQNLFSGDDLQNAVVKAMDDYQKGSAPIWKEYSRGISKGKFQEGALGGLIFGLAIGMMAFVFIEVAFNEGYQDFQDDANKYGN